jgi:hypothetical protein
MPKQILFTFKIDFGYVHNKLCQLTIWNYIDKLGFSSHYVVGWIKTQQLDYKDISVVVFVCLR